MSSPDEGRLHPEALLREAIKAASRELKEGGERPLNPGERQFFRELGLEERVDLPGLGQARALAELKGMIVDLVRKIRALCEKAPRAPRKAPALRASEKYPRVAVSSSWLLEHFGFESPQWSRVAKAELVARLEWLQAETLERLGLPSTITLEEIKPFVESKAAAEEADGEMTVLYVPTGLNDRGMMDREILEIYYGAAVEDTGEAQPLSELKIDAEYIAECTGCDAAEAVAFLLAGWIPDIPWINIDAEEDIPTVVMRVAIPRVTPREVGQLYEVMAVEVFGEDLARKRGSPLHRLDKLLEFVGARFPNAEVKGWKALFAEFDSLNPGAYEDEVSMQNTFRKYKRLLKYFLASIACDEQRRRARAARDG